MDLDNVNYKYVYVEDGISVYRINEMTSIAKIDANRTIQIHGNVSSIEMSYLRKIANEFDESYPNKSELVLEPLRNVKILLHSDKENRFVEVDTFVHLLTKEILFQHVDEMNDSLNEDSQYKIKLKEI